MFQFLEIYKSNLLSYLIISYELPSNVVLLFKIVLFTSINVTNLLTSQYSKRFKSILDICFI